MEQLEFACFCCMCLRAGCLSDSCAASAVLKEREGNARIFQCGVSELLSFSLLHFTLDSVAVVRSEAMSWTGGVKY